jgi:hypothetical protein
MSALVEDYDTPMQASLARVFGERDAAKRRGALAALYAADAVLYEPGTSATGHAAISDAVGALLSNLPRNVTFSALGAAVGHHGFGRLRWQSGPPGGPALATGTDFALIERGLIRALYVFLDPPGS